jgi:lipoprotein-anchoring transpeptidase ErfK/SrfK
VTFLTVLAAGMLGLVLVAAVSAGSGTRQVAMPLHRAAGATASPSATPPGSGPATPVALAVTPAPGTADLPVSAEIGTSVSGGKVTEVSLTDAAGHQVAGAMRDDGTSWIPAEPLQFATGYKATVTATGSDGRTATGTTTFTTMRKPGGVRVGTGLYLFSGNTYGVAMPVAVDFESDVPVSARAAVERRLLVHSDPPQPGAWHWFGGRQVLYRPPQYWQPGTKLTVRSALGGQPIGGRFGDMDRSATVTIGRDLRIDVDNATKQMTVTRDGQVIKTLPVSLGKPSTQSSSGTMVIMDKQEKTVFDTTREDGPNGYRIDIAYAQRLTWGGQFIHAAPWSVRDQGVRNVSHGCVNVSTSFAVWLFQQTLIGDPVTVRGTGRALDPGDGWTAWNMPWSEYAATA